MLTFMVSLTPQPFQQAIANSSFLLNRLLPNAFLKSKAPSNFSVDHVEFGFLRARFKRYSFRFNMTISYQNRKWLVQFRRRLTTNNVLSGLILTNVARFLLRKVDEHREFIMQNFSTIFNIIVPENVIGSVYGENGSNLIRLREISGAKVEVQEPPSGTTDHIVVISGTPDETKSAQSLLQATC